MSKSCGLYSAAGNALGRHAVRVSYPGTVSQVQRAPDGQGFRVADGLSCFLPIEKGIIKNGKENTSAAAEVCTYCHGAAKAGS